MRQSKCWTRISARVALRAVRLRDDRGSASIEFLTIGMLMTLPLVYLVLVLGQVQAGALAAEGAARHAARLVAAGGAGALPAAQASLDVALADTNLPSDGAALTITCDPDPGTCSTPGGSVQAIVSVSVPLPLAPPVLGIDVGLSIPIEAAALMPISEFRTP